MIYRCKRKKRFFRLKRFVFRLSVILITLTVGLIVLCESQLEEFVPEFVRDQSEIMSSRAISQAVSNALEKLNYSYNDIALIKYSESGNVQSIETDTIKLDKIKVAVTESAQEEIAKIYDCEVNIPFGAFTNISVLSGAGPMLSFSTSITGSFNSEIISTFEHAGINQTVHHIKLLLTSKINTVSLDYMGSITYTTDYEIAQTVIVGSVPSSYGNLYQMK